MRPLTVLFVCTGNTCRSPLAEAFARTRLGERVRVLSAGLQAADGEPASEGSVHAAAEWGLDLSGHRSRAVTEELLAEADWVIVMTRTQARLLSQRFARLPKLGILGAPGRDLRRPRPEAPPEGTAPGIAWFESLADLGLDEQALAAAEEVADPFGRGPLEYGATAAQLDRLLRGWDEALGAVPDGGKQG